MRSTKVHPIRAARLAANLTQTELAKKVRVEFPTISRWETGRHPPKPHHAMALIEALPTLTLNLIYGARAA